MFDMKRRKFIGLLNDRVIPLFESYDVKLLRILTDRGSEYCGNPERHQYELYLAVEDIDHSRPRHRQLPAARAATLPDRVGVVGHGVLASCPCRRYARAVNAPSGRQTRAP
jgi:hypothetical protein